jgi:hypothetical protein
MRQCQRIATAIGAVAALACTAATAGLMDKLVRSLDPELGTLEARLAAIAEELTTLPPPPRAAVFNRRQHRETRTPGSRAAHRLGNRCGRAIGRAILC